MDAEASAKRPSRGRFALANDATTSHVVRHAVRMTAAEAFSGAIERPTRRVAAVHPSKTTTARSMRDRKVSYGRIGPPGERLRGRAWP
jgi:hypothetical protein